MKKILHILSSLDSGGVEMMLYNYYHSINKNDFSFSFIVHGKKVGQLEKEFIKLGCNVYHVVPKKKNFLKNILQIQKIIKSEKWDVLYCHQGLSSFFPLFFGMKRKVTIRILHVHGIIKKINFLRRIKIKLMCKYSTKNIACSNAVGNVFFKNIGFKVINNGIEIEKFKFNYDVRTKMRESLSIKQGSIVLLQVGRLSNEKNQLFSINLMPYLPCNYILLIVGNGKNKHLLERNICDKCKDRILFLNPTKQIQNYYFASDCLLFPSLKEGLGMVAVEAQTSGLPVFASCYVTLETKICDHIYYLPLVANEWVRCIQNLSLPTCKQRKEAFNAAKASKFNIDCNINSFIGLLNGE